MNGLLFPLRAKRSLHLTTPITKGGDVRDLQKAINLWAAKHRLPAITVDGQFGPLTSHAAGATAFSEGLLDRSASKTTIRLIWHPWMRTPAERKRAAERAKASHGLDGLPLLASQYIGVAEMPPGSNRGNPHPDDWERNFGMAGVSWCGCFAGSMVLRAGGHVTSRVAYTPFIEADAQAGASGFAEWTTDRTKAGPGWLVLYNWAGGSTPEHVGIVESFTADHVTAIEGNTGGTNPSDGGMVARMDRTYNFVLGYARPVL